MKNLVLVFNLDTIKNKNVYQFNAMKKFGYSYACFGYLESKTTEYCDNHSYTVYPKGLVSRITTVFKTIWSNRRKIHHIELYTGGGSFLLVEYLVGRVLGVKVCVVERGSPLLVLDSHYGMLGTVGRKYIYKNASVVWIRELWMKEALSRLGRTDFFFLSNAIEVPIDYSHDPGKKVTFVWCNSLKKWRNVEWLIDLLNESKFADMRSIVLGLLDANPSVHQQQEYAIEHRPQSAELLKFQDPRPYLIKSKFFVLPADIVYLNFALLEAMAYGVVPIVSDVEGARDIVEDGVEGLVAAHSKDGLRKAMEVALEMSDERYETLSRNARKKVVEKFSIKSWSSSLNDLYSMIQSR